MSPDDKRNTKSAGLCVTAVTALLIAGSATAAAQQELILGDLYGQVRTASSRVEAGRALARAIELRVRSAGLPEDPQLQLALMNRSLSGFEPMPGIGMTQVSLMQMIPVAGQLRIRRGVARSRARAADERAGETEWEVRAAVAMAFYEIYSMDAQLGAARETLRLLQDFARTAEAMYRVGDGRQSDVLRAQVEIARMSADTIRMRVARESMVARLSALLDRAQPGAGTPALPAFPETLPTVEALQATAEQSRWMLLAASSELDAAEGMRRLARREIWPDLRIGAAYAQGPGFSAMGEASGNERMISVMLGASVPVFARSRQFAMREEATAMAQMARADLAAMAADTRAQIAVAHADLERARQLQNLYRSSILPQAQAAVESALSAYRVGSVDFMTLLDNQMTVNEYRSQLAVLQAEEGKAWAELEMLVAASLFDPNSTAAPVAPGGGR